MDGVAADRREASLKVPRLWIPPLFVVALTGCAARHAGPPSDDGVGAPRGAPSQADAGRTEAETAPGTIPHVEAVLDAGMGDVAAPDASAGWANADTCVSVTKGTARCCQPSAQLSLCVEPESPHHTLGAYDSKFLVVREVGSRRTLASFVLERRTHFSMKYQDLVLARLELEVTPRGLLLVARWGCNDPRDPVVKKLCAQAGEHVWRDGGFASER